MNITIYCNNCGNKGHLYKHCKLPVLSYGIIIFNKDKSLLMIQRKDSLSYIEFLRGKYKLYNEKYIFELLNNCSVKELNLINTLTFDELWTNLWNTNGSFKTQTDRMIREYNKSKLMFNKLKEGNLEEIIQKCSNKYLTPEWEFPKGRRSNCETNIDCAIREFEEETDIKSNEYEIIENISPISEEYLGSNGVKYKHIYYIAYYKGNRELSINNERYEQYSEIGDIKWLSIDECYNKIKPKNTTKNYIINTLNNFMKEFNKDFYFIE